MVGLKCELFMFNECRRTNFDVQVIQFNKPISCTEFSRLTSWIDQDVVPDSATKTLRILEVQIKEEPFKVCCI